MAVRSEKCLSSCCAFYFFSFLPVFRSSSASHLYFSPSPFVSAWLGLLMASRFSYRFLFVTSSPPSFTHAQFVGMCIWSMRSMDEESPRGANAFYKINDEPDLH